MDFLNHYNHIQQDQKPALVPERSQVGKGPLILLCRIISVECTANLNSPLLTSNQSEGNHEQPISMKRGLKFVGHSTETIRQSKIKGPYPKLKEFILESCSLNFIITILGSTLRL